jgi:uncharacterized protein involved in exopolysaccharide biosynthesis
MEFYRIWRIFVGHKWVLIGLPIIATCVALALTYVLPEQYESSALVIAQPFEDIEFNSNGAYPKELPDFPVTLSGTVDTPSKTYMAVIKSPEVAAKIVATLQLQVEKPKRYASVFAEIRDEVKTWVKNTIRTARDYLKYGRDIPLSPFDQAVADVEENLAVSAQKDTYAFEIAYRSSDPKEAAAVANMAAAIFLEQRTKAYQGEAARARRFAEIKRDESREALEQARAATLTYENSGQTFEPDSEYNEKLKNVSSLQYKLAASEGDLAGLRITAGGDSPKVLAEQAQIAELKKQIMTLQLQLDSYPAKQTRLDALTLAERLAKDNYEFFSKRYEEARVKEAADVTEIRVVSRAVPSEYPVKPIKYIYGGLSFGTALIVALGWVLFFESLDPRVRTMQDLDDVDVLLLGVIPILRRSRWNARNLVLMGRKIGALEQAGAIQLVRSEKHPDHGSLAPVPGKKVV